MAQPHTTLLKFGYPQTLVKEYQHWAVLLRPSQVTLGSLILCCREDVTSFGSISPEAFSELKLITQNIESNFASLVAAERINYLMLMMVDPHVHFHVIPRYEGVRQFSGVDFPDHGWPKPPALDKATALSPEQMAALCAHMRDSGKEE